MNTEYNPMDPALEQAMSEITDEALDPAVIEAAAARVWANVVAQAQAAMKPRTFRCAPAKISRRRSPTSRPDACRQRAPCW